MTATNVVLLTISSLSLITSGATLVVVIHGSKRVQQEIETQIEEVKEKTNRTVTKLKNALEALEF